METIIINQLEGGMSLPRHTELLFISVHIGSIGWTIGGILIKTILVSILDKKELSNDDYSIRLKN